MGYFTARTAVTFDIQHAENYTYLGRVITFFPAQMRLTGADKYNQQSWQISAGISAQQLSINPLGVSAPAAMLFFLADQPVDMRFGDAAASAFLSAVTMLTLGAVVSGLYITTSNATQVWLFTAGGSAAVLQATIPNS